MVSVYVMTMITSGPKNAASDPYTRKYELRTSRYEYDEYDGTEEDQRGREMKKKKSKYKEQKEEEKRRGKRRRRRRRRC